MLHFNKLTLRDFGPYKGEQTIDFSGRSGVSIFWGNNGRGKTTLLNAFRYGLFGVIQRRNGILKNLSEMGNSEAAQEGRYGFAIILDITNNGDTYKLTHQMQLRPGITTPCGEKDYEDVCFLDKNGSILSKEDRDHELNVIMPELVARFFLFDAELLQEYEELLETNSSNGEQIKNSIEKILGVPVLQNGVVDIEDCLLIYEKQKSSAASADDKTVKLGQEMENLTANIEEHQNIIKEKQDELRNFLRKKNFLEGQMADTDKLRNWIVQRNEAQKSQTKYEDDLVTVQCKIKDLMESAWKGMLLTTVRDLREKIEVEEHALDAKKQKGSVADRFIIEMKKAINDRTCPVCGQGISGDVIEHLHAKINESTNEYTGLSEEERQKIYNLQNQIISLRQLSSDVSDVKQDVAYLENRRDELQIAISECRQQIEELRDNIKRYGEDAEEANILSISREHSDVEQTIHDIRRGIEDENKKLTELKTNKDRVAATIDKMAGGTDYRLASRKYEMCEHIFRIFEKSKSRFRERLKENVEKDATALFVQLTGDKDYVGLKINDNYGLEIIHKSGRTVPGRSSGYEHVVALSLIGALHKNAPLRGPIIMDSPFGRLDQNHKANIIRALPNMAEQIILLAYVSEIDEQDARLELGNHLIHEFKLQRVSSMHTEIV